MIVVGRSPQCATRLLAICCRPPPSGQFAIGSVDANAIVRGILDLHDKLLADIPETPLLKQIAQPGAAATTC